MTVFLQVNICSQSCSSVILLKEQWDDTTSLYFSRLPAKKTSIGRKMRRNICSIIFVPVLLAASLPAGGVHTSDKANCKDHDLDIKPNYFREW